MLGDDEVPSLRPRFNSHHRPSQGRSQSPVSPIFRQYRHSARHATSRLISNDGIHRRRGANLSRCVIIIVGFVGAFQVVTFSLYLLVQQAPSNLSFNALTGEWMIPRRSKIITVSPHNELPIENDVFKARIASLRAGRSTEPKGVSPDLIGKRFCEVQSKESHRKRGRINTGSCIHLSSKEAIILLVGSNEDAKSMVPILDAFLKSDLYTVYALFEEGVLQDNDWSNGAIGVISTPVSSAWLDTIKAYSPVAIIGTSSSCNTLRNRAVEIACHQYEGESAPIFMPPEDFQHALWVATLSPVALASWHVPNFSVSIITNDRPWSLNRLLESLCSSALFGTSVSIAFNVESSADDDTLKIVQNFEERWKSRGRISTTLRTLKAGLIRAVTESYYPNDRHHHCVLLEDDIEVSPLFFAWVKYATLTYHYGDPSDFEPDLYGVSLYTPRVNEIAMHQYKYNSNRVIAERTGGVEFMPYLHQTPCSWGGVYFPETWMEFRAYLAARLKEEHIVVHVPAARTTWWKTSWKRFFIEMAYQRDYYMLYPNYLNQTSFATNWLEPGQHIYVPEGDVGKDVDHTAASKKTPGDNAHRPKDYTVPLMNLKSSKMMLNQLPTGKLPPLKMLPRLDILDQFVGDEADISTQFLRWSHSFLNWCLRFR